MAYTLNSAKDSQGNEDQFVADFAAHQPQILAYQKVKGGDLEHAYQAVTGKPWPAGRSVKIHDGAPQMTKDRTVKSVLGKYVAPIALGVAAPYLLPLLAGGGAAAGGAAAAGAGGASTATIAGAGTGIAGAAGGATAAGTAAAASPSLLHALLPTIIGTGAQVAGGVIQANAAKDATKAQTEAADKAIALQKEQYALQRQDTAPYRALGQGAVGNLGYLSGIDTQSAVPALSATVPTQPYGTLSPTQAAPGAAQTPQMVQMKSPTGQVGSVPADQVDKALAAGGQRV